MESRYQLVFQMTRRTNLKQFIASFFFFDFIVLPIHYQIPWSISKVRKAGCNFFHFTLQCLKDFMRAMRCEKKFNVLRKKKLELTKQTNTCSKSRIKTLYVRNQQ